MALTPLPTAPSRADPANFATRADATMAALPTMVTQINAALPVIEAASSNGTAAVAAAANAAASAAAADSSAALAAAVAGGSVGAYPTLRPTLLLDFANGGADIDPRIAFTRSSTATRVNARGLVETVAANTPRLDNDPVTLARKGLLIEESRTNSLTYSEQIDNAAWTKARTTVTANAVTSPDGTVTADKLVEDTQTGAHQFGLASFSFTSGTTYTLSCYVKAAERVKGVIQLGNGVVTFNGGYATCTFDLAAVTATKGPDGLSCGIAAAGNGWYRVWVTGTADATASDTVFPCFLHNGTSTSYTGDGSSGMYVWGAQLEAGTFPTSYIPTTSSTVTRSADAASLTGAGFSSWFRADEGTLVCALINGEDTAGQRFASLNDGTSANVMEIISSGGGTGPYGFITAASVQQMNATSGIGLIAARTSYQTALAYRTNDSAYALNGTSPQIDTTVTLPVVTTLQIGSLTATTLHANACIKRLAYYPVRLSSAQLQAVTAP